MILTAVWTMYLTYSAWNRPLSRDMTAPGAANSRHIFLFSMVYPTSPSKLIWPSMAALDLAFGFGAGFFSGAALALPPQ